MPGTWSSQEMFEDAVRHSYKNSVSAEEYENKCESNPDAVRKIAYYFRETGYDIDLFDDTSNEPPNSEVQLLFDFLNFTDGI